MRLHVGVRRIEELLRALLSEDLDLVDFLTSSVVPLCGIPFRVFVVHHRADCGQNRTAREVLRRDHLELAVLTMDLTRDRIRNLGIDLLEELEILVHMHLRHTQPSYTFVSQLYLSSISPLKMPKKRFCNFSAIGPRRPSPILILSIERIGEISAAVPVKNTSSAM